MLMQKHSPNNKAVDNIEEINAKSVDSLHSNGHFFSGRNPSLAGSECNDDKSNDGCSSDDESHEHDNTEQENQTAFIDSSNRENFKASLKKKKKKTVKVKFAGSQDDKAGIKLKIRRTNNFNQDENHVIVDNAEQQRKRHLKNKRCKSLSQDGSVKIKSEESDDNLPQKRSKTESDDESHASIGVNTISKGTEVDEICLGQCQAGTRLSLESVVLMETKSGILIVSVQWRGKTLMGALMEAERFQIGSLEKDCIYRRDKLLAMNRRNTRRKSKNLFGKKKPRKLTTTNDSGEHGGGGCTENEAGNSDLDNPYICDKESCHMRFADFQTLRVHIYQRHRVKGECKKGEFVTSECKKGEFVTSECKKGEYARASMANHQTAPLVSDLVKSEPSLATTIEERNTFSPAYSDISDANEAPVLENEAEQKPPPASVSQPPINLSLCHKSALLGVSNRMLFSPTAPALQPEVSLCPAPPHQALRQDGRLSHVHDYRSLLTADPGHINGFIHSLSTNHKPPNGALSLSSLSNIPVTDSSLNSIQDLSLNATAKLHNNHPHQHKTAPSLLNCHKAPVNRHQSSHNHSHHHIQHSSNTALTNGVTNSNNHQHSKHSLLSENGMPQNQALPNGLQLLPFMSFSQSVNNQNNKYNHPINHMYHQPKY